MTMDIPYYNSPIDLMYVIHHALRAEEAEVTRWARQLGTVDTLVTFGQALAALLTRWERLSHLMSAPGPAVREGPPSTSPTDATSVHTYGIP